MTIAWIGRATARTALLLLAVTAPLACGGGSGSGSGKMPLPPTPSRSYVGTQSPGDLWSWALHPDGTFDATNDTLAYDYAGTYSLLPSAYLKLSVTSSTEPGITLPSTAYAIEIPGSALVVKPVGGDSNVVVAVATSTCPPGSSFDLGWVELTRQAWDPATASAYGVADVSIAGGSWTLSTATYLLDGTPADDDILTGLTCSEGIVLDPAEPDAVIAIAPTGVFVRDGGPGQGGVIGMRLPASAIDLDDLTREGREFRGFDYEDHGTSADDSTPVWSRGDGEDGLQGGEYADIEANVEHPRPPAVIEFGTQTSPGIVNGTLTDEAGSSDIVFLINRLGGRYFVFGISVDTNDEQPYNFIAIETGP